MFALQEYLTGLLDTSVAWCLLSSSTVVWCWAKQPCWLLVAASRPDLSPSPHSLSSLPLLTPSPHSLSSLPLLILQPPASTAETQQLRFGSMSPKGPTVFLALGFSAAPSCFVSSLSASFFFPFFLQMCCLMKALSPKWEGAQRCDWPSPVSVKRTKRWSTYLIGWSGKRKGLLETIKVEAAGLLPHCVSP